MRAGGGGAAGRAALRRALPRVQRPALPSDRPARARVTLSYSFVKKALQAAHLVGRRRPRGRHRRRREPRPCFGELLHLDGSLHGWLALVPDALQTLMAVVDDATKQVLYAQLGEPGESADV